MLRAMAPPHPNAVSANANAFRIYAHRVNKNLPEESILSGLNTA